MEGLRSSEQEAQEIVHAIPQTIAVLSPDGQPLYGNRFLLQYTGLSIAGMTSADFPNGGAYVPGVMGASLGPGVVSMHQRLRTLRR